MKVWDLHMESKPIETFTVHEYLRSKLCSLYENDCIFDKFEVAIFNLISGNTNFFFSQCCWNGTDSAIMTGSYNNFFRWVLDLMVFISFRESSKKFSLDVLQF